MVVVTSSNGAVVPAYAGATPIRAMVAVATAVIVVTIVFNVSVSFSNTLVGIQVVTGQM